MPRNKLEATPYQLRIIAAVKDYKAHKRSAREIARDFDVWPATVYNWIRAVEAKRLPGGKSPGRPRTKKGAKNAPPF